MGIITRLRSSRLLLLAYTLFLVSMLAPTFVVDLGSNINPPLPGYKIFLGGPVAAVGIMLEPGGERSNVYLGIYYFIIWLANLAMLLPLVTIVSQYILRLLGGVCAVFAWSVLAVYYLVPDNLILEIGIGYYLWAFSITLMLLFLSVRHMAFDVD